MARGVQDGTEAVVDTGKSRTAAAVLQIAGIHSANAQRIGVLKRMLNITQGGSVRLSQPRLYELYSKYEPAIVFAEHDMPREYRQAGILSQIAKAYAYGVAPNKITRFKKPFIDHIDVLMQQDADLQPAMKLKALIDTKKIESIGGGNRLKEFTSVCGCALNCFLRGEQMKYKRQLEQDPWPLPENMPVFAQKMLA